MLPSRMGADAKEGKVLEGKAAKRRMILQGTALTELER
jgi:hypothetical protein